MISDQVEHDRLVAISEEPVVTVGSHQATGRRDQVERVLEHRPGGGLAGAGVDDLDRGDSVEQKNRSRFASSCCRTLVGGVCR